VTWTDLRVKEKHVHRRIPGLGESTVKSPSKALLIPGDIIDAVVQRAAQLENK
jgi:hypothetical protein